MPRVKKTDNNNSNSKDTRELKHLTILPDRCKGCGFCIEFCPVKALEFSEDFNARGYHSPRMKDDAKCIYCGMCQMMCPDMAIFVEEDPLGRFSFE